MLRHKGQLRWCKERLGAAEAGQEMEGELNYPEAFQSSFPYRERRGAVQNASRLAANQRAARDPRPLA